MAKYYDTILGEYIKNPWKKWISLDKLSQEYFDYKMISFDYLTQKNKINFWELSLDKASSYSIEDVYITKKLYSKQQEEWISNERVLQDIEIPLLEVLCEIELAWVKIDKEKLKEVWDKIKKQIEIEKKAIFEISKKQFNINSPKQVWELLFVDMWLPHWKKTKTWYSVDNEVLENLSINYPIAKHISNYRQLTKLLSTYVEGLSKMIKNDSMKIHTSYNQTVTTTWRLSSTNPNLQNIPAGNWLWWDIRSCFIPFEPWDKIMSFDYSQVEVRLLAIMSQDSNLLWSFKQGLDIHKTTWSFLFWKDDINDEERKIAKSVNFWVIYWISPFGLSKMIWQPQKVAKEYIDKFYEKYPKVWVFFEKIIKDCEKNWYVETMFWRKRFIPNILDRNAVIRNSARREAINMPIQWTSADIIKIAMIKISKFLKEKNLKSQMIMQVHDEIVFNVKENEIELLKNEIPYIMENIIDAPIKLTVDYNIWNNWLEAK